MPKNLAQIEEQIAKLQKEYREAKRGIVENRKSLYGLALMRAMEAEAIPAHVVHQILDKFITSKSHRNFLELPPLPDQTQKHQQSVPATPQQQNNY